MKCEHLKLVRGADGVLRCMDCGEALDWPEGLEKKPEPGGEEAGEADDQEKGGGLASASFSKFQQVTVLRLRKLSSI